MDLPGFECLPLTKQSLVNAWTGSSQGKCEGFNARDRFWNFMFPGDSRYDPHIQKEPRILECPKDREKNLFRCGFPPEKGFVYRLSSHNKQTNQNYWLHCY